VSVLGVALPHTPIDFLTSEKVTLALLHQPVQVPGQLKAFFNTIREGQAPDKFTREHLADLGYGSSNHHAFIPLLKGLGFLTSEGTPTQRYRDYLNGANSKRVIAEALREAYSDIFILKARPTRADKELIAGKFRSAYNASELSADRAANTFLSLLELTDEASLYAHSLPNVEERVVIEPPIPEIQSSGAANNQRAVSSTLHYNIQIHLPATKDLEVYNAIFKSLRIHILD
jgi:hypothetical protein